MNKNLQHDSVHTGSTFQSFLEEEGISEEVRSGALKQLAEILEARPTKETTAVADSEAQ